MRSGVTELTVFVSSPSDVAEERHLLAAVVGELNRTWSASLKVRLDLVGYETHAVPGLGVDAQDVINHTLTDNYDIFIGIMWARFGTPTARAESGTEEEFERALARYRADPTSLRLMFYFKDDPIPPSELDIEQYSRVVAFRKRLQREGLLYWSFVSPFDSYVRIHLARQIQDLVSLTPPSPNRTVDMENRDAQSPAKDDEVPDEPGVVDALDDFLNDLSEVGASRQRVLVAVTDLANHFQTNEKPAGDLQSIKRAANRAAEGLEEFVRRADVEIPIMTDRFESAMQQFGTAMALASEFVAPEQLYPTSLRETLYGLVDTLSKDATAVAGFRDLLIASPRITTQLNRAKRRSSDALASLARVFESQRRLLAQLLSSFPATRDDKPPAFRPSGLAAGEFIVPDDFDAPLPADILESFEGK
jgi:hypothetical protein